MVDFSTPNLCGASAEFNKLMSQFDNIKDTLFDKLEEEASDLAEALGIDMDVLDVDLRALVPVLQAIKSANLQSEITSLLAMHPTSAAYIKKAAEIAGKFGISLSANGYSLDSLIATAASNLIAGLDLCADVPNFELPTGATAAVEKAKAVLQPTTGPAKEILSIATVDLNSAVSIAKTAAAAKVALFAAVPSDVEGVVSGAFKTATKTEEITYPAEPVQAVTYKNVVASGKRKNYASKGGLAERTIQITEELTEATGTGANLGAYTLTHQPIKFGNVWAYSPDWPAAPEQAKYIGIHGELVEHVSVSNMNWVQKRRSWGRHKGERYRDFMKFYDTNGKKIKIIDYNGNLWPGITKIKVGYSYLSNYDPRFTVEE